MQIEKLKCMVMIGQNAGILFKTFREINLHIKLEFPDTYVV